MGEQEDIREERLGILFGEQDSGVCVSEALDQVEGRVQFVCRYRLISQGMCEMQGEVGYKTCKQTLEAGLRDEIV